MDIISNIMNIPDLDCTFEMMNIPNLDCKFEWPEAEVPLQGGKRHHFIGASDPTGLAQVAVQRYRAPSDRRRCGLQSADKGGVVLAAGSERGGLGPANIPAVLAMGSWPLTLIPPSSP